VFFLDVDPQDAYERIKGTNRKRSAYVLGENIFNKSDQIKSTYDYFEHQRKGYIEVFKNLDFCYTIDAKESAISQFERIRDIIKKA